MLIINAVFATFALQNFQMTPERAFTVISIFNVLQEPLRMIPSLITATLEAMVSIKRLNDFLQTEEIDIKYISYNTENYNS